MVHNFKKKLLLFPINSKMQSVQGAKDTMEAGGAQQQNIECLSQVT